jgi:hypothetical protein
MPVRFPTPIDHCFILCDPEKEPDRANYLRSWLQTNNVDSSCVSFTMPTYGTDSFFLTRDVWRFYNPWNRTCANPTSTNLKSGELSLLINFALVADMAVKANHKTVMILESDVFFCEDFLKKLTGAMTALPSEWDFLSLSASADLRPQRSLHEPERLWFPPIHPYYHTRCTDSMIFRVSMLEKILTSYFPVAEPLDWELNYHLTLHNAKSLWLDPPILRQGSGREYATTL